VTPARMTKVSVLVAAAALALSGCGMHPGTAAVVGADQITDSHVDAVAQALCSANASGGAGQPAVATRGARQGALRVLLDTALSVQFGRRQGVVPSQNQVSAALAQNHDGIQALPKDERAVFTQALKEYAEGQLMLIDIGRRALTEQGKTNVTDTEAVAEGQRLREKYAKTIKIEVDPRYGTFTNGTLAAQSGSLSVAESKAAKAGQGGNATWVGGLPATQRCGA
jgi:hypothetical protein